MVSNVTDISDKVVIIEICSRQVTILLLETFSIRFFDGKPQTPKYHVTTALRSLLQIAVHVWTAGRASSGKWFTARIFLPLKIVQILVLRHELAFYIRLRCARWIFDLESMNYFCFLDDKSDALRLDEKQHGGTKQWTCSSNRFYIPFCHTNIWRYSVPIQS